MSGTGPGPDEPGWAAPAPPPAPPVAPPASVWTPPPPSRRRKGRWLFVLVPLLVVFAAGVVFLVVEVFGLVTEPIDATNEYLAEIRAGRYEAAYARTCTGGRWPTLAVFLVDQRRAEARLGRLTSYDITGLDSNDEGTFTKGTWTRGGATRHVTFEVQEENGDWKVCGTRR